MISVPPDIRRALREHVRRAAKNLPGTYRMVAADGEVLYVGKSKQIRTRLLSYFRARKGEKGRRILEHACRLEWDYEPSEFAALLGELRLIKKLRPRFNVQHKRDGRYSFLKLTGGAAPRLLVTRAVSDDSATYFGPFRGGRRIDEAVRELNDVLGLRDCALGTPIFFADQQDLFSIERAPRCHRLDLRRCIGPCAGRCSRAGYLRRVELARSFLDGNADEPIRWLCERMQLAVDRWDFEHAASIRDRIRRLELLRDEFGRLRDALDSLSFLYPVAGAQGDDRVYLIRRGTVRAALPAPRDEAGTRELERISREQFGAPEASSALVTRHQVDEILLLSRWFRLHPRERDRAIPPLFGEHSGTTSGHATAAPTG